jgi:hypothetical protein
MDGRSSLALLSVIPARLASLSAGGVDGVPDFPSWSAIPGWLRVTTWGVAVFICPTSMEALVFSPLSAKSGSSPASRGLPATFLATTSAVGESILLSLSCQLPTRNPVMPHAAPTINTGSRRPFPMGTSTQGSIRMVAGRMLGAILCRRCRMKDRRAITERRRLRIASSRTLKATTRNANNLCSVFTVVISSAHNT